MNRVTTFLIAVAISVGVAAKEPGHMDERGPTFWVIDGRNVQIDRTYFRVEAKDRLAFVVEWTCSDCQLSKPMSQEEALAVSRPVLWFAVEKGETGRTAVTKFGSGRLLTKLLTSVVNYQVQDEKQQITISVDKLDALFDWTWVIGGKSYRIFGPGYYFDQLGQKWYFIIKWHDRALCDQLTGITEERAANLAMPLLKEIVSRKLFEFVPRVGIDRRELVTHVNFVGVEIGCPDPACAGTISCPARGYRVARTLAEIAAAP